MTVKGRHAPSPMLFGNLRETRISKKERADEKRKGLLRQKGLRAGRCSIKAWGNQTGCASWKEKRQKRKKRGKGRQGRRSRA